MKKWFTLGWYKYLFEKKSTYYYNVPWEVVILCRIKNHPCGPVYYNPCGTEPDNHCINCGDEL